MFDELKRKLETLITSPEVSYEYAKELQLYLQDSTLRQDPYVEQFFTTLSEYIPRTIDEGEMVVHEESLLNSSKALLQHIQEKHQTDRTTE